MGNDILTIKDLQPCSQRIHPIKQFQACTDFKMVRNIKKLNLYSKPYQYMVWDNFLVVKLSFLNKNRDLTTSNSLIYVYLFGDNFDDNLIFFSFFIG